MTRTVRVKVNDWGGVASPIQFLVLGTIAIFGIVLIVPVLVYLEVTAFLARRRIRKEQEAS